MPFAKLFKSRWSALILAGGILWTAVDVADYAPASQPDNQTAAAAPTDATGEAVRNSDLIALAVALNAT